MKKIIILLLVCGALWLNAITVSEIKQNYMYGMAKSSTLQKADKRAINDLISQISIQVESNFTNIMEEEDGNLHEFTQSIVKTYSNSTLHNAERKVLEEGGKTIVYRYIKKSEMNKIFANREKKILDYTSSAVYAEQELRIADALRNYYWALVLLRSHPAHDEIKYTFGNSEQLLITTLPERIERIFADVDIAVSDVQDNALTLNMHYQNLPLQNLEYDYWTGDARSRMHSARNGIGTAELQQDFTNLKLRVEYIYQNKSRMDIELWQVLEETNIPTFSSANFIVPIKVSANRVQIPKVKEPIKLVYKSVLDKTKEVMDCIDNGKSANQFFTEAGFEMYEKLIDYGNAKVLSQNPDLQTAKIGGKEVVRGIPMSFSFPKNDRDFVENVVFTFDDTGKIEAVSFALSDIAVADIMDKNEQFGSLEDKYQIVQFMEQYKTAYCLKNIDYIEQVFSENALIIVGTILKQDKPIENMYKNLGDKIEYVKYSKQEYVERLKMVFGNNEFVNIHFEDNKVQKSNKNDKVYGIQISQYYYSENYADSGYLFLMFDLTDSAKPQIYVRTWQPEKDEAGKMFELSDFKY
ncbi:MAG: LPP20 family lipoprotein [Candidatus Cloacimonetes bacterium]|nr:LPP20 family lipoprotein [Candidatus Cloacimonadota bacterium]